MSSGITFPTTLATIKTVTVRTDRRNILFWILKNEMNVKRIPFCISSEGGGINLRFVSLYFCYLWDKGFK